MATRKGTSAPRPRPAGAASEGAESIVDRFGAIEVPNIDALPFSEVDRIRRATGVDLFGGNLAPGKRLAALEWSARSLAGQAVSLEDIYRHGSMGGWNKVAAATAAASPDEDDEDQDDEEEPPDPTRTRPGR